MDDVHELIKRRKKQILVHSFLYYQMNTNIITDHLYDEWCKELAELLVNHPEERTKGFEKFDGSSGFDLPFATPEVQSVALNLLKYKEIKNH